MNEKTYYSVLGSKKYWTEKEMTISDLEKRGYRVQESRLHGDFDVFKDHKKVATLFSRKSEAAAYIFG